MTTTIAIAMQKVSLTVMVTMLEPNSSVSWFIGVINISVVNTYIIARIALVSINSGWH